MVDRLLRVHIQSQRAFGPRWTLSYNKTMYLVAVARPRHSYPEKCCDTCELHTCVADCADAMADAWEATAGFIQPGCLHGNVLRCLCTVMWGLHGIVHTFTFTFTFTHDHRLYSEDGQVYAYSHDAAVTTHSW